MISPIARAAAGIAAVLLFATQTATAAELKVFSTPALSEVWHDLKPKFEASGHKLDLVFAQGGAIAKRLTEGESADVIISTAAGIEALSKSDKVLADTRTPVAGSGMGVAVLKGKAKPDISTPEKFKQALLAAKAVAYTDPASGGAGAIYFAKVLEKLGIAQQVNAKAKLARGVSPASFVVKGEADLVIQQVPELMAVQGVEIVGQFPGDLQNVTAFAAAVAATSKNADAARKLVKFLQSPEAVAAIKARGLEPLAPQ